MHKFRHPIELHKLGKKLLSTVNGYLAHNGIKISHGTIVDVTTLSAPSSTNHKDGQWDPELNKTAKGRQWYFGVTAHVGVDGRIKLAHTAHASAANVADCQALSHRLRGQTDTLRSVATCARHYTNRRHRFGQWTGERIKAKILALSRARANVERSIGVITQAFGFQKVRYRDSRRPCSAWRSPRRSSTRLRGATIFDGAISRIGDEPKQPLQPRLANSAAKQVPVVMQCVFNAKSMPGCAVNQRHNNLFCEGNSVVKFRDGHFDRSINEVDHKAGKFGSSAESVGVFGLG